MTSCFVVRMHSADALFIDLDGTIYNDNILIDGASSIASCALSTNICFISNTGVKTDDDVYNKLIRSGFFIPRHRFVCYTAREHLTKLLAREAGQQFHIGGTQTDLTIEKALRIVDGDKAGDVTIGVFVDKLGQIHDLCNIVTALSIMIIAGSHCYFTSHDATITEIVDNKRIRVPGPGCLISMLKSTLDNKCIEDRIHVVGKGKCVSFMEAAKQKAEVHLKTAIRPSKSIVIGDRPDTDIRAGLAWGATTYLVGSGCFVHGESVGYDRPHFYVDNVGEVIDATKNIWADVPAKLRDLVARTSLGMHARITKTLEATLASSLSQAPVRKIQSYPSNLSSLK